MNENLSGSWCVAPTVSEDAGKTTQPGDKRSGCWTRCKTRRRYTPIVTKPEISAGHHNKTQQPLNDAQMLAAWLLSIKGAHKALFGGFSFACYNRNIQSTKKPALCWLDWMLHRQIKRVCCSSCCAGHYLAIAVSLYHLANHADCMAYVYSV